MKYTILFIALLLISCTATKNEEIEDNKPNGEIVLITEAGNKHPLLGQFFKDKSPENIFDTYAVITKDNYTFIFGIEQDYSLFTHQVAIYKDTTIVTVFNTSYSDTLTTSTDTNRPRPKQPNTTEQIYLADITKYIEFRDYNEDGLFDFNLYYDHGGTLGPYHFVGIQNPGKDGFTEIMNDFCIFYNDSTKLLYSFAKPYSSDFYAYGYNPKTSEIEFENGWIMRGDTLFYELRDKDKTINQQQILHSEDSTLTKLTESIRDSFLLILEAKRFPK